MTGRIVRLEATKKFGFIKTDDYQSIFFHKADLTNRQFEHLAVGYPVEFQLVRTEKGLKAEGVTVL